MPQIDVEFLASKWAARQSGGTVLLCVRGQLRAYPGSPFPNLAPAPSPFSATNSIFGRSKCFGLAAIALKAAHWPPRGDIAVQRFFRPRVPPFIFAEDDDKWQHVETVTVFRVDLD